MSRRKQPSDDSARRARSGRAPRPPTERPRHPLRTPPLHPIDPTVENPNHRAAEPFLRTHRSSPIPQAGLGQEPARTALPANPPVVDGRSGRHRQRHRSKTALPANPPGQSLYPTPGPPARTRKTPPPRPARRARPPPPPPRFRTRLVSTPAGRVRKMIPVSVCGASRPEVLAASTLSGIGATRSIPLWADPADFFVIP